MCGCNLKTWKNSANTVNTAMLGTMLSAIVYMWKTATRSIKDKNMNGCWKKCVNMSTELRASWVQQERGDCGQLIVLCYTCSNPSFWLIMWWLDVWFKEGSSTLKPLNLFKNILLKISMETKKSTYSCAAAEYLSINHWIEYTP